MDLFYTTNALSFATKHFSSDTSENNHISIHVLDDGLSKTREIVAQFTTITIKCTEGNSGIRIKIYGESNDPVIQKTEIQKVMDTYNQGD